MNYGRKILIVFMLFFHQNFNSIQLISLGGDCTVAGIMRQLGLRRSAYPFDWMYSHFEPIYKAIEDDFKMFLDSDTLKVADDKRIVVDFYGLAYVHDFPTAHHSAAINEDETHEWAEIRHDWRNFIVPIKQKYQRRIERFKNAFVGSDPIFLVRYPLGKEEAIKLRDLLVKKYPLSNFILVAVTASQEGAIDWGLEKIKNFSITYGGPDFLNRWRNMYNKLGINAQNIKNSSDDDEEFYCDGTCHHDIINFFDR